MLNNHSLSFVAPSETLTKQPRCKGYLVVLRWMVKQLIGCWICCFAAHELAMAQVDLAEFRLTLMKPEAIGFVHSSGASGQRYVIEPMSAGLALFDYDGDGLIDVYLLNGAPLPLTTGARTHEPNRLYRNLGNWRFEDVTERAGVGDLGYGLGVVAGDADNDGDIDLYVTNFGDNVYYVNNGDGTFSEQTAPAGLSDGGKFGAGACFVDIDRDGDLDLYCANYQQFTFDKHFQQRIGEHLFHPGPKDFPAEHDLLFENMGDGTFRDISDQSGIRVDPAPGMGVIAGDFNGDQWPDIFVCNDSFANFLFINDGKGKFTEEALISGLAFDRLGKANGNMGVDCGDFDNDGKIDLFTTTYQNEMPVLYRQIESGIFEDVTNTSQIEPALYPHVNWGTGFVDVNNDGHKDLYIACGHFLDNIKYLDDRTSVKLHNYVLANLGNRKFADASQSTKSDVSPVESSRGAAFDDLNNDGRVDVVVLNSDAPASVIQNNSKSNNWVAFELVGVNCNRDAAGAVLRLRCQSSTQTAMIHLGRGYQSHFGTRVHFGICDCTQFSLEILWPHGTAQKLESERVNQLYRVIEGEDQLYLMSN